MLHPIIAIIGAGNMGLSIIRGLLKEGYPHDKILLASPHIDKLPPLDIGEKSQSNTQVAERAQIIILAVKPNKVSQVLTQVAPFIQSTSPLIISVATGVTINTMQHTLGFNLPIIRAMPNTPATIGCGMIALYADTQITLAKRTMAEKIFQSLGATLWVDTETDLNAVTALSGSGPAYFFLIMEILQEIGEKFGLDKKTAATLTLQTAYGASRMALASKASLARLRQEVTSPGGTTEAAINVLEEAHIRDIFARALSAAKKRAEALAKS